MNSVKAEHLIPQCHGLWGVLCCDVSPHTPARWSEPAAETLRVRRLRCCCPPVCVWRPARQKARRTSLKEHRPDQNVLLWVGSDLLAEGPRAVDQHRSAAMPGNPRVLDQSQTSQITLGFQNRQQPQKSNTTPLRGHSSEVITPTSLQLATLPHS